VFPVDSAPATVRHGRHCLQGWPRYFGAPPPCRAPIKGTSELAVGAVEEADLEREDTSKKLGARSRRRRGLQGSIAPLPLLRRSRALRAASDVAGSRHRAALDSPRRAALSGAAAVGDVLLQPAAGAPNRRATPAAGTEPLLHDAAVEQHRRRAGCPVSSCSPSPSASSVLSLLTL
jgi:hypothetical protein